MEKKKTMEMKTNMKRDYIEEIKTSAQTIIDKADNIISEDDLWTSIDITIHVDCDSTASIIIKKEEVSQNMIDYYTKKHLDKLATI